MSLAQQEPADPGDDRLLSESFDRRTLLDMETALDRACSTLPPDERTHECRTFIAGRIIASVQTGASTQDDMMRAAQGAVEELEKRRFDAAALLAVASEATTPSTDTG